MQTQVHYFVYKSKVQSTSLYVPHMKNCFAYGLIGSFIEISTKVIKNSKHNLAKSNCSYISSMIFSIHIAKKLTKYFYPPTPYMTGQN